MRELLIFVPSIEDGGVEKNLFLISNYFANNKIKTNIITANLNKKKKFNNKVNFISSKSNFFNNKNRFYKTIFCFYLLFKFLIKKKNFLILSFQANIYAIFFAWFFRLDIITRSNTAPPGWSSNHLKRLIFKIFFKYPKKIIVNSNDFKNQIDKEFNVKSLCIFNPLDKKNVKIKSLVKTKINFFKKQSYNFINIGRMTDQKDQILILKAFNKIKNKLNFKLIILGKGKNKQFLQNYIKYNNLSKRVKIIGYKKNPYPYIRKADVFILSSKFEGLPNVLLESQYLKKIIVSTSCPTGPKEILLNGQAGFLFDIGNAEQLKKIILFITKQKNSKIVSKKVNIGFNSIDRFDFKKNINKYFYLIKKYL
tara:strand:- start:1072 stop:2169 length:1098 start_codon:yes stop_codon:yes gene_type:complete